MNSNLKIFIWSISAALGGFLFGFDTAVISGAEQDLQTLWHSTSFEHGLTVSIALIGTVLGALIGGWPADTLGRKKSLFLVATLYLISALGSALVSDWSLFLIFRFVGGVGVGISSVVAPMYISEIAPPSKRGRLVALFQFNIVLGILISYVSNYGLAQIGENAWRYMLGVEAFPALLFMISIFLIPESPRWLVLKKGKLEKAKEILDVADSSESQNIINQLVKSKTSQPTSKPRDLFHTKYRKPLILAALFALFNQLSGINAIIYYAPRVFEMSGLGKESALLSSAGIGLTNLLFTLLGLSLIDKYGRRFLMKIGSYGLIASLSLVAFSFYIGPKGGYAVPLYLFAFIAFFALSQGAVIWVFISEIFPNQIRAYGQSLGSFVHWIAAAIISFIFPFLAETFGGGVTFIFFALMMFLQLLFVLKIMPETKGSSLESSTI